jgi:hypothetical protein
MTRSSISTVVVGLESVAKYRDAGFVYRERLTRQNIVPSSDKSARHLRLIAEERDDRYS